MATGRVPTTANSPLTAQGDLFTYSTAPARLAVGNSGEQIVADSSTSTGLRYIPATIMSNPVLNACADIWQRGTSVALSGTTGYTADRWFGYSVPASTFSRQATGDTTNLPNVQYAIRVQRNSGNTSTGELSISQSFESTNSIPFAGKAITFSFYARAGANYSATSSLLSAGLFSGTGTDQNLKTAYTGLATVTSGTPTLTTTWQRFSYTGTVAATATELAVSIGMTPVGTAGANDYFEFTGVQIDIGSVALPVRRNGATIQGELAACQRYYRRVTATENYSYFAQGMGEGTTQLDAFFTFPVTMRTTPSVASSGNLRAYKGASPVPITASAIYNIGNPSMLAVYFAGLSGVIDNAQYMVGSNNNTTSYFEFGAEL